MLDISLFEITNYQQLFSGAGKVHGRFQEELFGIQFPQKPPRTKRPACGCAVRRVRGGGGGDAEGEQAAVARIPGGGGR